MACAYVCVCVSQAHEVLNEVLIDRGSSSFLTNIECYEKGRFITRVQADGIMLATPTGTRGSSWQTAQAEVHRASIQGATPMPLHASVGCVPNRAASAPRHSASHCVHMS